MSTNDATRKLLESEKRERLEQLEGILRRLNPQLTDEQLGELMRRFRQQSGLIDS